MRFEILSFFLVGFFVLLSLNQQPLVESRLVIRNFIATASVAMLTSADTYNVFYIVAHPQPAFNAFYAAKGFAPAWLVLSLRILSTIFGAILWTKAAALAGRRADARPIFLRVWPLYIGTWLVLYVVTVQAHGAVRNSQDFFCFYILGTFILTLLASAIFLHFRASSSDSLFLPRRTA